MEDRKILVAVDWCTGVLSLPSHRRNNEQTIRKISNKINTVPTRIILDVFILQLGMPIGAYSAAINCNCS